MPQPGMSVGHLLRRCHQVHNAAWAEEVGGTLTSPQYSLLSSLERVGSGLDQHTVGVVAGLDRSTTAGIVRRLEDQGWLRRHRDPRDGRRQLVVLTEPAAVALAGLSPAVRRVQSRLLAPLSGQDRDEFIAGLASLAGAAGTGRRAGMGDDAGMGDRAVDDRPGHLIRLAQQRHTQLWAEEVGAVLTGPQFAVLEVLRHAGALGQGALAHAAAVDRSSASDVLRRLERRGWMARAADPSDRRTRNVALTPEGERVLAGVTGPVARVQERLLESVSGPGRRRLVGLLATVAGAGPGTLAPGDGGQ